MKPRCGFVKSRRGFMKPQRNFIFFSKSFILVSRNNYFIFVEQQTKIRVNDMAKYVKQEMNDLNSTGKKHTFCMAMGCIVRNSFGNTSNCILG